MKSNKARWTCLAAVVLTLMLPAFTVFAEEKDSAIDSVAIVNGVVITRVQFDSELSHVKQRFLQEGREITDSQLPQISDAILETLINRELLFQESQKMGIRIKEQAISEQFETIQKTFPNEDEFKKTLNQMNLSEPALKLQINKALAIKELIEKQIVPQIVISDEESKVYYDTHPDAFKQPEQIKASHILIKVDSNADASQKAKAREQIEEIRQKIKAGDDFAELAKEFSQGPSSARGGDLGYFRRGQMVKPFEDAAFALEPDAVSDIVETPFGYHLIKLHDRKPERIISYPEVKDKLNQYMKQEKTKQEVERYIQKLKQHAEIKKFF